MALNEPLELPVAFVVSLYKLEALYIKEGCWRLFIVRRIL